MNRRRFLQLTAASGLVTYALPGLSLGNSNLKSIDQLPIGFKAIIDHMLSKDPGYYNTDWDGTMAMESLLGWSLRGVPNTLEFAQKWLDFHIDNDQRLTDEQIYDTFPGPRSSRIIRGQYLPFTMYSGFFGLPFPCFELYKQNNDKRARQVCLDVANAILHQSARDRHGLVLHDDGVRSREDSKTFTIPDTIYFVTKALMIASLLDKKIGIVYQDQALHQIKTCTSIFLDKEKNIARTILFPHGLGKSFWCRASGWLTYALSGVLSFLPKDHPEFEDVAKSLKQLADGVKKYQGPNGGLHVLVDEPDTPEETSSIAMCIASIKQAVVNGWIPNEYDGFIERGWDFVKNHVSEDGKMTGIYTGWALPAEQGQIIMDQLTRERPWIPAVILHAANVMTS